MNATQIVIRGLALALFFRFHTTVLYIVTCEWFKFEVILFEYGHIVYVGGRLATDV